MAKVKKVSVVTVCLNTRDEIRLTLESVANQTFPDVEHVIIDGGSSDGTLDIVSEYPVGYLVSEKDDGVYDAMQKGAKAATGTIVIFLNAGDTFYDNETCEKVASFFELTNADIVFGNLLPVYLRNGDTHDHGAFAAGDLLDLGYVRNKRFLYDESIHHQATFYRRKMLLRCPYECPEPGGTGEYNVLLNAVMKHKAVVKHIPLPVSRFVLGGISTRNFDSEWKKYVEARDILRSLYCPDPDMIEVLDENEFIAPEMPPNPSGFNAKRWIKGAVKKTFIWRAFERGMLSATTRITNRVLPDIDHLAMRYTQELFAGYEARNHEFERVLATSQSQLLDEVRAEIGNLARAVAESQNDERLTRLIRSHLQGILSEQHHQLSLMRNESKKQVRSIVHQIAATQKVLENTLADVAEQIRVIQQHGSSLDAQISHVSETTSEVAGKLGSLQDNQESSARLIEQGVRRTNASLTDCVAQLGILRLGLGEFALRPNHTDGAKFSDHGFKVYSQWDEDGLLRFLIDKIGCVRPTFVEIGVGDYSEANTRYLVESGNWSGLVIDSNEIAIGRIRSSDLYWRYDVTAISTKVNRDNANEIIAKHGFEGEIGVLSIDIDGIDYWVWDALDQVNPCIVICEYNGIFGPAAAVTVPYDDEFDRREKHFSWLYAGASFEAMRQLGTRKGYTLIGTNKGGNNMFFVRDDLLNDSLLAVQECEYKRPKFREARTENGSLAYTDLADGIRLISDLSVYEISSETIRKISELRIELPQ